MLILLLDAALLGGITRQAIESVIGTIPPNSNRIVITASQARDLEEHLGLLPNSLENRNILSIVDNISDRNPRSPKSGNALFLGEGQGLPGGGKELVIDSIPSAGGVGIKQIIIEVKP